MKISKKVILSAFLLAFIGGANAQSAIVRGQVSAGVYENLVSDGAGHLIVTSLGSSSGNPAPVFTNTNPAVTNATTVSLVVNTARKYLQIQNNDAAGIVFCTPTAAATLTNGIKILPGQAWTPTIAPQNAINCIGSIANNANVIITEGQ